MEAFFVLFFVLVLAGLLVALLVQPPSVASSSGPGASDGASISVRSGVDDGDLISGDPLTGMMKRCNQLSKVNPNSPNDEEIRKFVNDFRSLFDRYDQQKLSQSDEGAAANDEALADGSVSSADGNGFANGHASADGSASAHNLFDGTGLDDELMQADSVHDIDKEKKKADETIDKTGQVEKSLNSTNLDTGLRAELKKLLVRGRQILEYHRNMLQQCENKSIAVSRLQEKIDDMNRNKLSLEQENTMLKGRLEKSKTKCENLNKEHELANRKLDELTAAYEQKKREFESDQQKIRQLQHDLDEKLKDLASTREQHASSSSKLKMVSSELQEKEAIRAKLNSDFENMNRSAQSAIKEKEQKCDQLRHELERAIEEKSADADSLRAKLQATEKTLAEAEQKMRANESEYRQQLSALKSDMEFQRNRAEQLSAREQEQAERSKNLAAQVDQLKNMVSSLVKEMDDKSGSIDDVGNMVSTLRNQCKLYQKSMNDEKQQVEAMQNKLRDYEQKMAKLESTLNETQKTLDKKTDELKYEHGEFEAYKAKYNLNIMRKIQEDWNNRLSDEFKARMDCLSKLPPGS